MNNTVIKIILSLMLFNMVTIKSFANDGSKLIYEIESLFPMYFFGGYHVAVGIRYEDYRFRASCIDGGSYDYERNNDKFERNLGKGCGVFAGYFINDNWHIYGFVENQPYIVTKRDSGVEAKFDVVDIGSGVGYQYFLTEQMYIQPELHLYWRKSQTKTIDGSDFTLREVDISPTVRIGYRI